MKKNKGLIFLLITLIFTTVGCSLLSPADDQNDDHPIEDRDEGPVSPGLDLGESAQWPTYLPDEIPILTGEIQLVMGAPDTKVRIFYAPLSDNQIEQYLQLCQEQGYKIEYLVYTQEGSVDRSVEKLKAGDYDAIEMTRGAYRLRLEYGSDGATLDIYPP